MKGNYLWPAMWSSMFYLDDTQNGQTASDWGIFMGTSHHEQKASADKEQGDFSWVAGIGRATKLDARLS